MTINWISSDQCNATAQDAFRRMQLARRGDTVTLSTVECESILDYVESLIEGEDDFEDIIASNYSAELEKENEDLKAQIAELSKKP